MTVACENIWVEILFNTVQRVLIIIGFKFTHINFECGALHILGILSAQ